MEHTQHHGAHAVVRSEDRAPVRRGCWWAVAAWGAHREHGSSHRAPGEGCARRPRVARSLASRAQGPRRARSTNTRRSHFCRFRSPARRGEIRSRSLLIRYFGAADRSVRPPCPVRILHRTAVGHTRRPPVRAAEATTRQRKRTSSVSKPALLIVVAKRCGSIVLSASIDISATRTSFLIGMPLMTAARQGSTLAMFLAPIACSTVSASAFCSVGTW
mmetsp:Transcript_35534/g.98291  ORF Transcript_35534/g.98291 Transcript_35534/m.98291 type:complete len:217 (-) Transcript_35534:1592-2242(-)